MPTAIISPRSRRLWSTHPDSHPPGRRTAPKQRGFGCHGAGDIQFHTGTVQDTGTAVRVSLDQSVGMPHLLSSSALRADPGPESATGSRDGKGGVASGDGGGKIEGGLEVVAGRDGERLRGLSGRPCVHPNVKGLYTFAVGEMPAPLPNTSGGDGMPRIGQELGRGAEGVVYENLDQPGWVVKEYHQGGTSPLQARNEFQNLERARAIRPDNVVKAQAPADPRQGFLVKEQVLPTNVPEDLAQKARVIARLPSPHP